MEEANLRPLKLSKQKRLEEMALFLTPLLVGTRALETALMKQGLEKGSIRNEFERTN